MSAVVTTGFVTEAISKMLSGVTGCFVSRSARP